MSETSDSDRNGDDRSSNQSRPDDTVTTATTVDDTQSDAGAQPAAPPSHPPTPAASTWRSSDDDGTSTAGRDDNRPTIQVNDSSSDYALDLINSRDEPGGFVLTPHVSPRPSQQDLRGQAQESSRSHNSRQAGDDDDVEDDGKA